MSVGPLTIGQLAKQCGVNLDTVRYYERRGLLPKPPRSAGGYRSFSEDTARRLRFIKRAQGLGFTLNEVQELLALRVDPAIRCGDVLKRAEAKSVDIEQKIRQLRAFKNALNCLMLECSKHPSSRQCSLLETLETDGKMVSLRRNSHGR